jgi:tripartite-type tricarboxylate transporter receptor subunit TctC
MPEIKGRLMETLYMEIVSGTPQEFRQYLSSELAKWQQVAKSMKL